MKRLNKIDPSVLSTLWALYRNGDFETLAARATSLIQSYPDELVLYTLLGSACMELGDYETAVSNYRLALSIKPDFVKAHNSLGIANLRLQRYEAAVTAFRNAIDIDPRFAPAWFNLGIVYEHQHQWILAAEHYLRATHIDPGYAEAFNSLGTCLWRLGRHDQVAGSYEKALEVREDFIPAYRNLLNFLDQSNQDKKMATVLDRARKVLGNHPLVLYYQAVMAERGKDYALARSILEAVNFDSSDPLARFDERQRLARLAQVCDKLNQPAAAFQYAESSNWLSRELAAENGIHKETFRESVDRRQAYFTPANVALWNPVNDPALERPAPIFIIGFPRSGTTLLDTILRGHPSLTLAEESPAVPAMIDALASLSDNHLEHLAKLTSEAVQRLRKTYFKNLPDDVHRGTFAESRLIDRYALNIVYVGEIHRIFPEAKYILLLRHPADCVLSCFMHAFTESSANANFFTLEDTADLYSRLFGLWHQYTRTLDLDVFCIRYEDIIEDVEQACRPLLEFIDMPWHPNLLNHETTAREREFIGTASYNQVTQPLYRDAAGRWLRYREFLEPVMPVLDPWIQRFGYGS